jgi:nucleotide-binding universal stress UspA family protein
MFNKVLVAIDEQTRGSDAITLARRLVSPTGKLILAHVHPGFVVHGKGDNGEFEAIERQAAFELLQTVNDEFELHAEMRCIGSDRTGAGLHRLADTTHVDLLVLGSSRAGRNGRVLLTEETRHAINGAPCAVAVAPLGYADTHTPIMEIGVAYNGSEESRAAITTARALAQELGAAATAFEALPLPIYDFSPGAWDTYEAVIRDRRKTACDEITGDTGLRALAACGETVDEIAVFSGVVDLLVVGSRDYGPLGRLVHGSTTHRLLRYARSPLLILTRGARRHSTEQTASPAAGLTTPSPSRIVPSDRELREVHRPR